MRRLESFPTEESKDAFEAKCLADGWIKPKSKGGRPAKDDDPFEQIATEIEATAAADAAALDAEIEREVKKRATKARVTGKGQQKGRRKGAG